jgi:hypothetical protein
MRENHQLQQPELEQQLDLECWQLALVPALLGDLDQPMQVALALQLQVQRRLGDQLAGALDPQI